jgi:thiamine-monophosphate kinase
MEFDEAEVIRVLADIFATSHSSVIVGIGDDGAVVRTSHTSVITTDMAVEGTHFNTAWSGAFDIGRKITAANLADIYAMGGTPSYLVVAVTLIGDESLDLTRGAMKVIAITAVGTVEKAITRSGAKAGESIYLSTLPGWSAAGLLMVSKESSDDLEAYAIEEFCAPSVDYSMAQSMAMAGATSMCDISDALVIQAEQIARASGVHLAFKQKLFEVHPEFVALIELAIKHDIDAWQWICAGGEDHVFLATGKDLPGLCVGVVMEGSGVSGLEMKKAPDTWRHFN